MKIIGGNMPTIFQLPNINYNNTEEYKNTFDKIFINFKRLLEIFQKELIILDGRHIKNITITTGDNNIKHALGRNWNGYIITNSSVNLGLYATPSKNTERSTTITLTAGSNGILDLWVF